MSNGAVESFVSYRVDADARTTDIDAVWREFDNGSWTTSAWPSSVSVEEALVWVADELALPYPDTESWPIDFEVDPTLMPTVAPEAFGVGVFEDDPAAPLTATVADSGELVGELEGVGYEAGNAPGAVSGTVGGPVPEPPGGQCGCEDLCILNSMAAGVAAELAQAGSGEQAAHDFVQAAAACCIPWTWTTATTPWNPWACCGAWVLDPAFPSPVMNGPCSANCHYERDVCRTKTRTRVRRLLNCTRCTWTETKTQTGQQKGRVTVNLVGSGCAIPPGFACPLPPAIVRACAGGPDTGVTTSGWVGTPPC
ncbi:MAG: hypothetical protein RIB60_06700 [Phycisphaerales bacterium]